MKLLYRIGLSPCRFTKPLLCKKYQFTIWKFCRKRANDTKGSLYPMYMSDFCQYCFKVCHWTKYKSKWIKP